MDSEIAADYSPMIKIYKSGRIERLLGTDFVPASLDPKNAVLSKDVVYSPENNLSVRLFVPRKASETAAGKMPLLVYFHGGGFIIETAFSPTYCNFLTAAVAAADCLAVSVDYRRAPEHPIPVPYDDSWAALKWVFTHYAGSGPEDWLNKHADFNRVFLAGDSAGANIAHYMGIRAGKEELIPSGGSSSVNTEVDKGNFIIKGIVLVHPFFWGKAPVDEHETKDESVRKVIEGIWTLASPNSAEGVDDPLINVNRVGSDLARLGCNRVLVQVAGKDKLVRRGWAYAEELKKSGWGGEVEVVEAEDEEHVFHLMKPNCENALEMMKKFVGFIQRG